MVGLAVLGFKHRTNPMFPNQGEHFDELDTRLSCSCNAQRRHCVGYEQAIAYILGEKLPKRTDFQRLSLDRNMRTLTEPAQIFGNTVKSIGHPNRLIMCYHNC